MSSKIPFQNFLYYKMKTIILTKNKGIRWKAINHPFKFKFDLSILEHHIKQI